MPCQFVVRRLGTEVLRLLEEALADRQRLAPLIASSSTAQVGVALWQGVWSGWGGGGPVSRAGSSGKGGGLL